jgi:hypothetical protein
MEKDKNSTRLGVKEIIREGDNRERYKEAYREEITQEQIREVEKMLGCGEKEKGYVTYICMSSGEKKEVGFSCKSRVCSSCGKVHADEWSKQMAERMLNVVHRHITFTVPSEMWEYLEKNEEMRKKMFVAAKETIGKVMGLEVGIAMVMHPYGKDLKTNSHLHTIKTEGGMDEEGRWKDKPYISYAGLRKIWQYEILSRIREEMEQEEAGMIERMYKKYPKGFYVHAAPRITEGEGLSRYIGRYIRHPAIADKRIEAYDGERVTFSYKERNPKGGKVKKLKSKPVLAFIHGIVRHIPPKQFKMVRYMGCMLLVKQVRSRR